MASQLHRAAPAVARPGSIGRPYGAHGLAAAAPPAALARRPSVPHPRLRARHVAARAQGQDAQQPPKEPLDTVDLLDAMLGGDGDSKAEEERQAATEEKGESSITNTISLLDTLAELEPDTKEEEPAPRPPPDPAPQDPAARPASPVASALSSSDPEPLPPPGAPLSSDAPPRATWGGGMWEKWDVPWGLGTLTLGLVGVELSFIVAGVVAPFWVFFSSVPPDYVLPEDTDLAVQQLMDYTESADNFYKVFSTAEVIQTVLGSLLLLSLLARYLPLPPELFHWSIGGRMAGDGEDEGGGAQLGPGASVAERREAQQKARGRNAAADSWLKTGIWGGVGTLAIVLVITSILYSTGLRGDTSGADSNELISMAAAGGKDGVISLFVCTCILAPIFEETIFRGFLLPSLTKWTPTWVSLVLTTVIFALVHQHNTGSTLQLLGVGAVAGLCYLRTRNLATPMLVHAFFNFSTLCLYFIWVK